MMKSIEIIGYKRANLGKSEVKKLRDEGNVPCVIYGGEQQIHFSVPMILFRELVYTADAHFVNLNIEGDEFRCILQDIQFHPVNDIIIHADFLELHTGKTIKMDIPIHLIGQSPGVENGGTLVRKRRTLKIKALPKNMPNYVEVDISALDFHSSIKVADISIEQGKILDPTQLSIVVVEIPRALKTEEEEAAEGEEGVEGEEGAEGEATEGGDAPAEGGDKASE